jgi:hypothetical protein
MQSQKSFWKLLVSILCGFRKAVGNFTMNEKLSTLEAFGNLLMCGLEAFRSTLVIADEAFYTMKQMEVELKNSSSFQLHWHNYNALS